MSVSEHNLIGWLCMIAPQIHRDYVIYLPNVVTKELLDRDWMWFEVINDCGTLGLTDKGRAIVDINGPDYGLETIPDDAEDQHRGH